MAQARHFSALKARCCRSSRQRGIALLSVLLLLTLLSLIAANFAHTTRGDINLARNLIDNAKADALAEAAIARSILGLRESQADKIWRTDFAVYAWRYKQAELRVLVQDEGGRIDVNATDPRLVAALLEILQNEDGSALLDAGAAEDLSQAIADFIDSDDDVRRGGAETADYRNAEWPFGPRNAPLVAVSDLRQVLGMTAPIYRRIEDVLTVYTGMASPHLPAAGALTLEAMAGFGNDAVQGQQDIPGSRTLPGEEAYGELGEEPRLIGLEAALVPRSNVRIVRLHAEARLPNGTVFARLAVVDLRGDPARMLHWSTTTRRLFPISQKSEE